MSSQEEGVQLVEVQESHLEVFFRNQQDTEANDLAKVFPRDRDDFEAHWARIMSNPKTIARTILYDDEVAGNINAFWIESELYVGYWIDRAHWGKGIATKALSGILKIVESRPIWARVATGNAGSIRVLERNGFVKIGEEESPETERYAACVEGIYRLD